MLQLTVYIHRRLAFFSQLCDYSGGVCVWGGVPVLLIRRELSALNKQMKFPPGL